MTTEPTAVSGAATAIEIFQLAEIRYRESGNNYTAPPKNPPHATASGAYQFIKATWADAAAATGVGAEFEYASQAPPEQQDANALWLLREYGINSSHAWKASGPYPTVIEIQDGLAAVSGMATPATPPQVSVQIGSTTWKGTLMKTAGAALVGATLGAGGMATQTPPAPAPVIEIAHDAGPIRLAEFQACWSSMRKAGIER